MNRPFRPRSSQVATISASQTTQDNCSFEQHLNEKRSSGRRWNKDSWGM
jgi:hypothetical protein